MGIDARMLVRTKTPVTDEQIRRWAYELGESFGHENFLLWGPSESDPEGRRALRRIEVAEEEHLFPEPGETLLQVSLRGRYYGAGYERGDLPLYLQLAEWLEYKIPGASVWYGGDHGELEFFGRANRERLFRHFVEVGHRPYMGRPSIGDGDVRVCAFCEVPMTQLGSGSFGLYESHHCFGCGFVEQTKDGGKTWQTVKGVGGRIVPGMEEETAAL